MSDKGTISPKEEGAEKRGRGRPRKQPQVKSGSDVSSFIKHHLLYDRSCVTRKHSGPYLVMAPGPGYAHSN